MRNQLVNMDKYEGWSESSRKSAKQQKIPNENYYLFEKIQKFCEH